MPAELHVNRRMVAVLASLGAVLLLGLLYVARRPGYVEEEIKISELLSASIFLAESAGSKVREVRELKDSEIGQLSKGLTKEGKNEYVTVGDSASHEIITSGLRLVWPNLRYQSEENDEEDVSLTSRPPTFNSEVMAVKHRNEKVRVEDLAIWIDPLDATQEYTEGKTHPELLEYVTVMICIAVKGTPIAGVIHQPFAENSRAAKGKLGKTYWSWIDHGVSKTVSEEAQSAVGSTAAKFSLPGGEGGGTVRVIMSRSHKGDVSSVAEVAFQGEKGVSKIEAAGAGYKSLAVAFGTADVYLHTTAIKKWDVCAGDALLGALGGTMTTRKGEELDYSLGRDPKNSDGIVAALKNHDYYLEKFRTP